MKKLLIAFVALCAVIIGLKFIASPLSRLSNNVAIYSDNDNYTTNKNPIGYSLNDNARIELEGTVDDMVKTLNSFCDYIVRTDKSGDMTLIYAFSAAVNDFGGDYNVMACHKNGKIIIATPVILGCY